MRLMFFVAAFSIVIVAITAWIVAGVTAPTVGPIVIGLATTGLVAIFIAGRLHKSSSLRLDLAILLFAVGILSAVPLHEFQHPIPALVAGQKITVTVSVSWKSLELDIANSAPSAVRAVYFLTPFVLSAGLVALMPPILARHRLNWEKWPLVGLLWGIAAGSALMSIVYATSSISGLTAGRGDINAIASLSGMPVWIPGVGVLILHALALAVALIGIARQLK